MSRLILRFIIALVTFTIGMAAAYLCSIFSPQSSKAISVPENSHTQTLIEKERTYSPKMFASGRLGRHRACFSVIETSDNITYSSAVIYFESSRLAKRKLQKELGKAVEIIKREPLFDMAGRQDGEKVIATFVSKNNSPTVYAMLLWISDSDFRYVSGSSLQDILNYEKDHRF